MYRDKDMATEHTLCHAIAKSQVFLALYLMIVIHVACLCTVCRMSLMMTLQSYMLPDSVSSAHHHQYHLFFLEQRRWSMRENLEGYGHSIHTVCAHTYQDL